MALNTDRLTGDIVDAVDVNQIAEAVNENTDDIAEIRAGIGGNGGAVPIFETQAQAQAWEAANPGRVALWVSGIGTAVTPQAPTFTDASGTANDRYTIPSQTGVVYKVNGTMTTAGVKTPTAGQAVTITAHAASEDYRIVGSASWSHTFSTATAPTQVTPTGPTWTDDTINGGGTWSASQTGVTYSPASGTATPGQVVTVTATPASGYVFPSGATTSWSHTFPAGTPAAFEVRQHGTTTTTNRSTTADVSNAPLTSPARAGSILVAALACDKALFSSVTLASGWTELTQQANTGVGVRVAWKVAAGGETTTAAWSGTVEDRSISTGVEVSGTSGIIVSAGSAPASPVSSISVDPGVVPGPALALAFVAVDTARTTTDDLTWGPTGPTWSGGYTLLTHTRANDENGTPAMATASRTLPTGGATAATATITGTTADDHAMSVVVFAGSE